MDLLIAPIKALILCPLTIQADVFHMGSVRSVLEGFLHTGNRKLGRDPWHESWIDAVRPVHEGTGLWLRSYLDPDHDQGSPSRVEKVCQVCHQV